MALVAPTPAPARGWLDLDDAEAEEREQARAACIDQCIYYVPCHTCTYHTCATHALTAEAALTLNLTLTLP